MGKLTYESNVRVDYDDRVLAHLQSVIGSKLRRDEPFFLSWKNDVSVGNGRTTVWVHSQAALVFSYSGGRSPAINPAWLDALMYTANSPTGLYVVPEPPAPTRGAASA